jgi:hypothetical protein
MSSFLQLKSYAKSPRFSVPSRRIVFGARFAGLGWFYDEKFTISTCKLELDTEYDGKQSRL